MTDYRKGFKVCTFFIPEPQREWRCTIDQYKYRGDSFITCLFWEHGEPIDLKHTIALFHVRRKILHGYTVRDCPTPEQLNAFCSGRVSEIIISQVRHNAEKHLTNYAYVADHWRTHYADVSSHTIAIFRVRRRVNNG